MSAVRERLVHRGFDLRLENGFGADEAREVVERVLATGGDRVSFVMARPSTRARAGRPPRLFVKAEFRRPDQPLTKRLRPARSVAEGRGYRAFAAAGIPVARLFAFGEQSRLRPRAGAIVVTEKVRGLDAARAWKRGADRASGLRVARLLARIHSAGLVHGDAVLRNFVLVDGSEFVIDLPAWSRWTAARAEHDAALFVGSAMKLGASAEDAALLLDAYEAAIATPSAKPAPGWRDRVGAEAETYRLHLAERDATRAERHARKKASRTRPGERPPATKEAS